MSSIRAAVLKVMLGPPMGSGGEFYHHQTAGDPDGSDKEHGAGGLAQQEMHFQ